MSDAPGNGERSVPPPGIAVAFVLDRGYGRRGFRGAMRIGFSPSRSRSPTTFRMTMRYEVKADELTTKRLMAHQVKGADLGTRYEGTSAEKMVQAVLAHDRLLKGAWEVETA